MPRQLSCGWARSPVPVQAPAHEMSCGLAPRPEGRGSTPARIAMDAMTFNEGEEGDTSGGLDFFFRKNQVENGGLLPAERFLLFSRLFCSGTVLYVD